MEVANHNKKTLVTMATTKPIPAVIDYNIVLCIKTLRYAEFRVSRNPEEYFTYPWLSSIECLVEKS